METKRWDNTTLHLAYHKPIFTEHTAGYKVSQTQYLHIKFLFT